MVLLMLCVASAAVFIMGARSKKGKKDLVIVNDTQESVRVEYEKAGKKISILYAPGDQFSEGGGFFKILLPSREGAYEIRYPFPRPKDMPDKLNLSAIKQAAKQVSLDDYDYYTEKGMIEDVEVLYEAIPLFAEPIY